MDRSKKTILLRIQWINLRLWGINFLKKNLNFDALRIPVFVVSFPSVDDLQLVDQDDAS